MTADEEQEFEVLKFDNRYEISTTEPWNFRKIGKTNCQKQSLNKNGYLQTSIGRSQIVHRMVAHQYINNDDPKNKTQVDHIDWNKLNNSIENLRWSSQSENMINREDIFRKSDIVLNELPPGSELINEYKDYEFDKYYYNTNDERIYMITKGGKAKVVKPFMDKNDYQRIILCDINKTSKMFGYKTLMEYLRHNF